MITLNFTEQQLSIIDKALQHLAFFEAAPIIADINNQIAENQEREAKKLDDEINRNR